MPDIGQHLREIARVLNLAMRGQTNNTMTVTLTASATTTTVKDRRISIQTAPHLVPLTANAAGELAGGALYVVPTAGQVVIHHASAASTDRTFAMSIIG
jgi:hypothetical protein